MIKYKLICKSCDFSFDSWFASSEEFEKLKKNKFLNCYNCNSYEVQKTLMAPKLIGTDKNDKSTQNSLKIMQINKKLKEYQKFIKQNFDYVGENFAYEARSIHYNTKKREKGIFGTASMDEVKELREEGIDAEMIPWVKDDKN